MIYDLIIIGGGPAGVAAGVYAARKKIKTLIITKEWGGESRFSPEIQNFIGIISISGIELAEKLKEHIKKYAGDSLEFDEGSLVVEVSKNNKVFGVVTDQEKKYNTKSIFVASGNKRKRLNIKGSDKFEHKGIVYCATCDAPLFKGKEVVVIGGGNCALQTALQLVNYASQVYILEYTDKFKGDIITQEKVFSNKKIIPIFSAEMKEIKGKDFVKSLIYIDRKEKKEKEIKVQGIFVEIGFVPNSEFLKDLVEKNKNNEIIINHKNNRTSMDGIWAGGDVTDQNYKQLGVAVGDGIRALEDIYLWLQSNK